MKACCLDRPKTNAMTPKPRNKTKKELAVELGAPGNVLDPQIQIGEVARNGVGASDSPAKDDPEHRARLGR
jgi:hypothetical protein